MSIAPDIFEHRTLLHDVSWQTYQTLRAANPGGGLRMTYDRGDLEIMSPSRKHERVAYLIGRMIDQWTLHHGIEIEAGRNTTFSREDLLQGLEPDNCYWIASQEAVRGKDEINLAIDPPPDLALEVDVNRSSILKLPIYQALGVPEVWRWQHEVLEVLRLDAAGGYRPQTGSTQLARFPIELAIAILDAREEKGDTALIQQFVRAIQQQA